MKQTSYNLLLKPLVKFYKRRILKDPFYCAIKQWKRDQGDKKRRYDYQLTAESVVVDVGGYHGDFAAEIVQRFGCQVVVFEPMPAFFEQCKQRFADEPRVSVYGYGLGAEDAVLPLRDLDNGSSFHVQGSTTGCVSAEVRDVASVWKELDLTTASLMKVNIEGGEYPLVQRLFETGLISRIEHLQVQFHDFVPEASARRATIREHLSRTHREAWCYPFVWESWQMRGNAQGASQRAA